MTPLHLLGQLFLEPMTIRSPVRLLMLVPLALAIAVVYKTIRCANVREVPLAALVLWATIVCGMLAVGIGLLAVFHAFA